MTRLVLVALATLSACTPSERAQEPGPAAWVVVDRRAELLDALAQSGSRRVIVDVSAEWCVPCNALRTLTFADARVQTALADYAKIEIDVSEESADQLALSDFFGATALPCVLRFDDARALHAALAARERIAPAPSLRLHTFVDADEMVEALAK